jgi:RNA polymerase sigma-70 factor, ECF subfamily
MKQGTDKEEGDKSGMPKSTAAPVVALPLSSSDPFEQLVREKSAALLNVSYRIVLSREEARDVLQDAFLRIYKHYTLGRIHLGKLRTYAYQSVVNLSIDRIRRRKPVVSLDNPMFEGSSEGFLEHIKSPGEDPRKRYQRQRDMAILMNALGKIKPRERSIFCLREMEGMSYLEIGEIMKMRPSTARTCMLRARKNLRRLLSTYFQEMKEE